MARKKRESTSILSVLSKDWKGKSLRSLNAEVARLPVTRLLDTLQQHGIVITSDDIIAVLALSPNSENERTMLQKITGDTGGLETKLSFAEYVPPPPQQSYHGAPIQTCHAASCACSTLPCMHAVCCVALPAALLNCEFALRVAWYVSCCDACPTSSTPASTHPRIHAPTQAPTHPCLRACAALTHMNAHTSLRNGV